MTAMAMMVPEDNDNNIDDDDGAGDEMESQR